MKKTKYKCLNCGNEWLGLPISEREDVRNGKVRCSECREFEGDIKKKNIEIEYEYEPNRILLKEIITQILICLKDRAHYFEMKDIMKKDVNFSESTAFRRLRGLRSANVLKKIGQKRYTVTEDFRKEMARKVGQSR